MGLKLSKLFSLNIFHRIRYVFHVDVRVQLLHVHLINVCQNGIEIIAKLWRDPMKGSSRNENQKCNQLFWTRVSGPPEICFVVPNYSVSCRDKKQFGTGTTQEGTT
ncbi:hypothetical protein NPIL_280901 [Nephila pilipes]|uniref:Uncharacterized protein n=1 Tax=Nephila pilipes TaxID=299642 RepID=A0A8X6JYY0_NEPPI|nr:hypothetical protein NPIL_280901 [Nephila pilipes]